MKKNRLFTSTLIAAAAAFSFSALPAFAETETLGNDSINFASDSGSTNWSGDTFTISSNLVGDGTLGTTGYKGSWIGWETAGVVNASVEATITGSGFLGIAYKQGSGGNPTTIDLTSINVENFSGQLCVVNVWNENTTVKLLGEQWKNVEYVFGGLTREWENDTTVGAGTWDESNVIFTRGIESSDSSNDKDRDILALQGNTTLAGVSGTSKDFYVGSINLAADEYITVTSEGTTLTIAGSSTYGFYGTVGSDTSGSVVRASIVMNSSDGTGKQTFGGANYLQDVTVTAGTLALEGVTNIAGSVTVATDSTLELGGEITLSETITNLGTVVIADGTSFVLDNLEAGHVEGSTTGYYELISGGTITYTSGDSFSFVHNGTTLEGWNLAIYNGNLYAYGEAGEYTWNGTDVSHSWNTNTSNTPWLIGGTDSRYFVSGSDVTFGTDAAYKIVNITEGVTAGTIAVNDNYTFVFADGIKVEASYVDVASGKTLTLQLTEGATSAEFHMDGETWYQFFSNANSRENHGTVEIGAGVTFYLSDSTETATIGSANYGALITGTGTLSVGTTGAMGLYLPEFQGTVIFREGTTIRIGHDNDSYGDTGIYGASSTLVFESGSGITLISNLSNWTTTNGDYRVTAALVFEAGSHTIATAGYTAEFSGAISGADATITITGVGNLTFSGSVDIGTVTISAASTNTFSGGGTIGTVTINAGATLVFSGDSKTYTITTITKTNSNDAGTLEVDAGTTVNAVTLNGDWHIGTIQVDGVLNISGTAEFGSGSGNTETFTGSGTVTVGTLQVGHGSNSNNGATVKIDGGLTFIANSVTTGRITNDSHIQLGNTTFGTSNANGLTFASTVTEVTLTASGNEKTTFNTNVYDVAEGKFTDTGTTITIGVSVVGGGDIAVTGNGTLALSGTSTLGSVTVDSGATLDLSGGTVSVSSSIQNSGTVVVNSDTLFVLDNLSGTTDSGGTTYVIISGGGSITGWDTLDASNFSISGSTITSVNVSTEGQVTIVAEAITGLIWDGGTGNWNTSETNWTQNGNSGATFTAGSDVWFERSGSGTVTVDSSGVTAGSVTVTGGTYSFAGGSIKVNGTFTINRGAEVDLNSGNSTISGNFVVEGTLKLAGSGGESGEILGTITINNGGRVELDAGDVTGYGYSTGVTAITINSGGTLYVGTTSNQTLGSCTITLVGGIITGVEGSNLDFFHYSSLIAKAADGAAADNPTVSTVSGVMLTSRTEEGTLTVEVQENAVLDVQSGFWAGVEDRQGNINKTGAGTLEVSGYFAINSGSLIVSEGTVILSGTAGGTISASGATNTYGFASAISVASGALLNMCFAEDTSLSGTTFSGAGTIEKSGSTKLTISNYTFGGTTTVSEGTLVLTGETILGGSAEIHVTEGGTLDLTGVTNTQTSGDQTTKLDVLYIEGGTVTVNNLGSGWGGQSTNFGSGMYNYTLQISDGGVLDVVAAQGSSGGGERAFAVTSGEGTYRFSGTGTSYLGSTERNIHLGDDATLIFDVADSSATLNVSMQIANGLSSGTSDSVTKAISTGSLQKTGEGTLILSGDNMYSGGTTISAGVLVAASSGALGTGTVYIDGGQLSIDSGVTITNNIEVTLSETYLVTDVSISPTSLGSGTLEPYAAGAEGDGIYAITGTGSLGSSGSGVTITLFIDDTIAQLLAGAGEEAIGFYLLDEYNISTDSSFTVSLSEALSSYTATYDATTGIVWIVGAAAPEPSMFGMIFGLSALGLVATRRRRRKVA